MKVSQTFLATLILGQVLSLSAGAQLKHQAEYEKWLKEQQGQSAPPAGNTNSQKEVEKQEPLEQEETEVPPQPQAAPEVEEQETPAVLSGKKGDLSFDFMHTKQNCRNVTGNVVHKPTFCTLEDTKAMTELSGMVKRINAQLDTTLAHADTAQVSIAYFSFSNKGVQAKLCELSKNKVQIRVFMDAGDQNAINQITNDLLNNPNCKDNKGRSNIRYSVLGGKTGSVWRLHHNKFMMIDLGKGLPVKVNFSSGNLSTFGASLHLDHWVMVEAPVNSNLVRAQKCVMQGLEAADRANKNDDNAIVQSYINERENCFDANRVMPRVSGGNIDSQIYKALEQEEIAPLFSPNNNNYVQRSFVNSINRVKSGGYIYIAIQHFLNSGVAYALINASNRGVDVRLLMEDDVLKGTSEVKGVDGMIQMIRSQAPRVQIRFAETNTGAGMMHNKLAILDGEMTFSGAGHYTKAALQDNWENFYFIVNKGIISSYATYFKQLWENSIDDNYALSNGQNPGTKPSSLTSKFYQIAN